jgi:Tol biopolymer transport system component
VETRRRLDAWKEIASYLGRDVTTVRRWEKREGLPVHRHLHRKLGSVYAYSDEIDAWWRRRSEPQAQPAPHQVPQPNGTAGFAASAAVLWLVVALLTMTSSHVWMPPVRPENPRIHRVALTAPDGTLVDSLALSPDGLDVAFAASDRTGSHLWIRRVESTVARRLEGTGGASFPFWAPDGRSLGFFAGGRLKRITVVTREVVDLAAAPNGRGGTWSDQDEIVYAPDDRAALRRVPAGGGPVAALTTLGRETVEGHAWPEFLPGGRQLLYTDYVSDRDRHGVYVLDVETGSKWRIVPSYTSAVYVPTGHLLYANKDGALVAQRFSPDTHTPSGLPVTVADRVVLRYGIGHRIDVSVSRTGLIAARSADEVQNTLAVADRTGRVVRTLGTPAFHSNPTLSPDGRQVLASVATDMTASLNLWMFDLKGGDGSRTTFGAKWDWAPVWSTDGQRIIFASLRDKQLGLYEQKLGSGADVPILSAPRMQMPESWSRDGRYLTYQTMGQGTRFDVWAWDLTGERRSFPLLASEANEGHSQISPDGRFIAYTSDESGRFEVYVKPFPSGPEKWPVSSYGGVEPRWRADGGELYYIAADRTLTAVSVTTTPGFQRGQATPLFNSQAEYLWQDTRNHYDVTPDGRHFVIMSPAADQRVAAFTLIMNWR